MWKTPHMMTIIERFDHIDLILSGVQWGDQYSTTHTLTEQNFFKNQKCYFKVKKHVIIHPSSFIKKHLSVLYSYISTHTIVKVFHFWCSSHFMLHCRHGHLLCLPPNWMLFHETIQNPSVYSPAPPQHHEISDLQYWTSLIFTLSNQDGPHCLLSGSVRVKSLSSHPMPEDNLAK